MCATLQGPPDTSERASWVQLIRKVFPQLVVNDPFVIFRESDAGKQYQQGVKRFPVSESYIEFLRSSPTQDVPGVESVRRATELYKKLVADRVAEPDAEEEKSEVQSDEAKSAEEAAAEDASKQSQSAETKSEETAAKQNVTSEADPESVASDATGKRKKRKIKEGPPAPQKKAKVSEAAPGSDESEVKGPRLSRKKRSVAKSESAALERCESGFQDLMYVRAFVLKRVNSCFGFLLGVECTLFKRSLVTSFYSVPRLLILSKCPCRSRIDLRALSATHSIRNRLLSKFALVCAFL